MWHFALYKTVQMIESLNRIFNLFSKNNLVPIFILSFFFNRKSSIKKNFNRTLWNGEQIPEVYNSLSETGKKVNIKKYVTFIIAI